MVSKGRHQKKEVAKALDGAESNGFAIQPVHNKGHLWGKLICLTCDDASFGIWSTPKNETTHAKQIAKFRLKHQH